MIKLERKPEPEWRGPAIRHHITKCEPFILNQRGKLAHRVKYAAIYECLGRSHISTVYWCNNGSCGQPDKIVFSSDTGGRMMCLQCEVRAVMAGLPTSSEIAGHHVCTGKTIAIKDCECSKANQ